MQLLFDLDGTLTDSRPGIINSIQHSLAENGLPVPSADELLWCVGPPILETFATLVSPTPHLFERAVLKYREHYAEVGLFENGIYPEIEDTLIKLRDDGHTLHVATSKAEIFAKRIIDHFGLAPYFASVSGSGLDGTRADKGNLIAHILERESIAPANAVMIGDRRHDMIGAVKNLIPGVGALWGYGTGGELMQAGASLCVRLPRHLPEMIGVL